MFFKVIIWITSILVGLFSFLVLIGIMAARNENRRGPSLDGPSAVDHEDKAHTHAFEYPTVNHFLQSAMSGKMPGNHQTTLPLFPASDMAYFSKPYVEWATSPWTELPAPGMGFLGPIPGPSPAPIIRVMHVMSGLGDIFQDALVRNPNTGLMARVERSEKSMKSRIWHGIAPMSEARWKSLKLDKEDNIETALSVIQQVVSVFERLAMAEVQGDIRQVLNGIWADIDTFQDAANALRTTRGEPAPEWSLSKLWLEYMQLHFENMEHQNRAWVFTKLKTLHDIWKDRFMKTFQSGRVLNDHQATIRIDHYDMMILNKIHDIWFSADFYIRIRTEGFIRDDRLIHPSFQHIGNLTKNQAIEIYRGIEVARKREFDAAMEEGLRNSAVERRQVMPPQPDFMEAPWRVFDRERLHKQVSPEVENPKVRKMEDWVGELRDEKVDRFGFVVYRLSYEETEEEWKTFLGRLRDGLGSGWEGVVGAEGVRVKARLSWVDGKKEGITEGDFDGARNHFKTFKDSDAFPKGLISKNVFLAVDFASVESFKTVQETDEDIGDFRGFLHAIDPAYDPSPSNNTTSTTNNTTTSPLSPATSSPEAKKAYPKGCKGTFHINDQLVWTDLYALFVRSHGQSLDEYWALAVRHPWGVYVGPTTGVMRREWRWMLGGWGVLWETCKAALGISS